MMVILVTQELTADMFEAHTFIERTSFEDARDVSAGTSVVNIALL